MGILARYMEKCGGKYSAEMLAYAANIELVARKDIGVARSIVKELADQRANLKLIASENYCSQSVQAAMGNLLTDKYSEGFPGNRFYAGCDNVDDIERAAADEAKKLFGCEHAFVQPHSGAGANDIAFWAILRKKIQAPLMEELGQTDLLALTKADWDSIRQKMGSQKLLGLDLFSGGHLTHGYRHNASAQMFDCYFYGVNRETGLLDMDEVQERLREVRPLVLLVGYSAYTRKIDFSKMRELADKSGAVLMVDMAHFAGLVAGGVMAGPYNPVPYADIVTSTTHKSLRGPRGGIVLCKAEYADYVDKACPHVMGGPLPHMMAAKAIALKEAGAPAFREYAAQIARNAKSLAAALAGRGIDMLTGGTDNHMLIINLERLGLTGRQGESSLRECHMTLNRNTIPYDKQGPWYTSGLRLGTPAVTTLGMGEAEMEEIADIMANVLRATKPKRNKKGEIRRAAYELDPAVKEESAARVMALLGRFALYPEIDAKLLRECLEGAGV